MSHRPLRSLFILVFLSTPAWSQGLPVASPEQFGFSPERLARIGKVNQQRVDEDRIVGAMGLIARHGKVVYLETWGMQNREKHQPMKPDSIFRIYSMTKPIASTAIMMLFEEGKLKITDPVSKYLPELRGLKVSDGQGGTVDAVREITIQDLLRHTSGLDYREFGDKDLAEMITKLSERPLRDQPGTKWFYGISTDVLARVVEVVSGQRFDQFLQERIFDPLGMVDTSFTVPEEKLDRFAELYSPDRNGGLVPANPAMSSGFYGPTTYFSGTGGLVSTAADYLRFCQMFLNKGELDGQRILGRKTVELMTIDHMGNMELGDDRKGYGFGLGFAVMRDVARQGTLSSLGLYDWAGAAGTHFWIDPKEDMIGIYMIQIFPQAQAGTTYGDDFRTLCYQALVD
jgi:CubicO group peptidase (beta-lactamase class C family)